MRTMLGIIAVLLLASATATANPDSEFCDCYSYIYVDPISGSFSVAAYSYYVDPYDDGCYECYEPDPSATAGVTLYENGNAVWSDEATDNDYQGAAEVIFDG